MWHFWMRAIRNWTEARSPALAERIKLAGLYINLRFAGWLDSAPHWIPWASRPCNAVKLSGTERQEELSRGKVRYEGLAHILRKLAALVAWLYLDSHNMRRRVLCKSFPYYSHWDSLHFLCVYSQCSYLIRICRSGLSFYQELCHCQLYESCQC